MGRVKTRTRTGKLSEVDYNEEDESLNSDEEISKKKIPNKRGKPAKGKKSPSKKEEESSDEGELTPTKGEVHLKPRTIKKPKKQKKKDNNNNNNSSLLDSDELDELLGDISTTDIAYKQVSHPYRYSSFSYRLFFQELFHSSSL